MPVLLLLLLLSTVALAGPTVPPAAEPADGIEGAATIEDPRALARVAERHLSSGASEVAERLFTAALENEEIERYIGAAMRRAYVRRALVAERMGRLDDAAAAWREGWTDDVHMTLLLLRMRSVHPEREALVAEGVAHLRASLDRAARGERVVLYRTSNGADRPLEVLTADEALARIRSGDGTFRYTWIRGRLDLAGIPSEELPEDLFFFRTVIDGLRVPDKDVHSLGMKAIVLGDLELGKTWTGEANNSSAIPASRFDSLNLQESLFLGRTVFQDVKVRDRMAYFVLSSFEGDEPADFRGLEADGMADFRFSVFRHGANYRDAHFTDAVYFGHTRYLEDATFRGMFSEQDVYFNSARFEGAATFDHCEWSRGVTFEDVRFDGPVSFNNSEAGGRLNMSRTILADQLEMKEMRVGGMDFIGAWLQGPARFIDVRFEGKVRFSLDDITRSAHLDDPSGLLSLYRDYQGDKDAMEPLTEQSSYGVQHVDDLIARIDGDLSFANSMFRSFCIFERVRFGLPDRPGLSRAEFYNTQFMGEAHFERTEWYAVADFETIFASELSFNGAQFHHSLILDDANVSQRATLTDAQFVENANLSFYGAEIASFQIEQDQLTRQDGGHRLFYEQCAEAGGAAPADIRMDRLTRGAELAASAVSTVCHDRTIDEWVMLKGSFGDRAMVDSEDWAYWHGRHTELLKAIRHGSPYERAIAAAITWPIFELSFGWGVRLGNLAITSLLVTLLFAGLYRRFCPDTVVVYRGADFAIRDVPWHGLIYISLQSLGAFNTGWDFGEDDWRFQYLNTVQTFIGIIVLTFFVGAYTRMILA